MLARIAKALFPLLAKSGAVQGPYLWKGRWFTKKEAWARRDTLCNADMRKHITPQYLATITCEDMEKLNVIADEV